MQNIKKILNILCYYLIPLFLSIAGYIMSQSDANLANDFYEVLGSAALFTVAGILFVKPLSQILPFKTLKYTVAFRRQLGVAAFWFALFHGVLYIRLYELFGLSDYVGSQNLLFLFGGLGLIGMIILGVTSNTFSVKLLKKNWKRLHYIVYPTFFLVLLHVTLAEGDIGPVIVLGGSFLILKFLAYKKITFFSKDTLFGS